VILVKNIPVRSLKNCRIFMDYCSSPPAFRSFSAGRLEESTHVCFSLGGGVLYRIAGEKPRLKKSKPAGFGELCSYGLAISYTPES